ncbi:MAG: NADH-quinone oxidoreductase subunit J [Reichenbachiella sp.]
MNSVDLNILAFYGCAGLIVFSALMILFSKNIVHAVFMLVITFLGVAGIYLISNAEFVGVTQIMIYIGGILILLMFGVMLTQRIDGSKMMTGHQRVVPGVLIGLLLLTAILYPIGEGFQWFAQSAPVQTEYSVTETIGINLMTDQLVVLELTAVLLLMALIGAAFLAGSKLKEGK